MKPAQTATVEPPAGTEPRTAGGGAPEPAAPTPKPTPKPTSKRKKPRRHLRTPVVPQMEEQDCGAACLAVVLGAFGRRVTLNEASRACGVSRDGVSAAAVARAAGRYGLLARGRRVVRREDERLEGLDAVPVPSMVLVTGPHFAVFEGVKRGRVYVNDPSLGSYSATPAEFWESFAGIAVGFEPGPDFERGGRRFPLLRSLGARLRPYVWPMLVAVLVGMLMTVPGVASAFLLRTYLSAVVNGGASGWAVPLTLAGLTVTGLVLAGNWLRSAMVNRVLEAMAARSSAAFLWRMLRLPGAFFHRRQLGGLVTRVQLNDGLANLLSYRVAAASSSLAAAAVHLTALLWLAPKLAAIPLAVAALDALALRSADRRRGGMIHRLHAEGHKRDGVAFAGVSAIETVKAEGAEDALFRSWAGWQARAAHTGQRVAETVLVPLSLPGALNSAAAAAAVIAGTALLLAGSLSFGTLLAFLLLLNGFLLPVSQLVGTGAEFTVARAQNALLEDIETSEVDPYLAPVLDTPAEPVRLRGELELRDLEFGYDPNRPPALAGISLRIAPGEWVAVVGGSGSGKSTLARLAAGVLRPWKGEVLLDGRPRDDWHRGIVTGQVAYVEQQLRLFEGTVRENLTLWDPSADEDTLHRALADAEATELVRRRGGLDAPIDEDARNWSGGERQRLEIARALALDPALIVLDEATSALDAHTEAAVNAHLRRRGTSCLVLAHRLSTIQAADRVVVIREGRIVQQGPPTELAEQDGPYRDLLRESAPAEPTGPAANGTTAADAGREPAAAGASGASETAAPAAGTSCGTVAANVARSRGETAGGRPSGAAASGSVPEGTSPPENGHEAPAPGPTTPATGGTPTARPGPAAGGAPAAHPGLAVGGTPAPAAGGTPTVRPAPAAGEAPAARPAPAAGASPGPGAGVETATAPKPAKAPKLSRAPKTTKTTQSTQFTQNRPARTEEQA
ncbi:ATP-binding cassette domain-containing protein [Kitasatospora cineracea]|uniref:ABC-type bacteriocin/lantibiotic exporter with double-glycine peptidase domain n=1 Tax=Kitasatospora cineracea TaxID=88074 RepID=A0A3N4RJS5_9ACTN|nr:ATP-binding cassette domain-containing protein [Kitasatospora cineracea]RPE33026.1 ABC-type bacteriocin/lantibiotic exporter with double-glycine peptidase domain [Kitasatospora cineracea]